MPAEIMHLGDGTAVKILPGKIVFLKDGIVFKSIGPSRDGTLDNIIVEIYTMACGNEAVRANCLKTLELCAGVTLDDLTNKYMCVLPSVERSKDGVALLSITDPTGAGYYMSKVSDMISIDACDNSYYSCYAKPAEVEARIMFILMSLGFFFGHPCPSNWAVKENGVAAAISTLEQLSRFCHTYN